MTRITSRPAILLVLLTSLAAFFVVAPVAPTAAQTCTDPYGCPGTTTTTTTVPGATTTTTVPGATTTTVPGATTTTVPGATTTTTRPRVEPSNTDRNNGGGNLARTGFTVLGLLILAAILVLVGRGMVEASRRRPTAS